MSEIPITESELVALLDQFGEYTKGKGATDFISSRLHIIATNAVLLKAQQGCALPDLLQLVAWGAFMAERGETHLTPQHH